MTDEELIARLRDLGIYSANLAADRVEALVKDGAEWATLAADYNDKFDAQKRRADRLEAALKVMRDRAMSTRGEQAYRELPVFIIRAASAALKGDDHV